MFLGDPIILIPGRTARIAQLSFMFTALAGASIGCSDDDETNTTDAGVPRDASTTDAARDSGTSDSGEQDSSIRDSSTADGTVTPATDGAVSPMPDAGMSPDAGTTAPENEGRLILGGLTQLGTFNTMASALFAHG